VTERCAIYARYSDEKQRETSIEDQIRRCQELGKQHSLNMNDVLVFSDAAITGRAEGDEKREGFKQLLEAWDSHKFTVLLVDEFSRLSRDGLTQAQLFRRLETNLKVRMLTSNGVDTTRPNWQLQLGLEGVVSQQAGRDTRHRVVRGMLGQLERGYMIATPAYGYELKREFDQQGNRIGSRWTIVESEAAVVREIFERRACGESMHSIARFLNDRGVPTRRRALKSDGGFWRPAAVQNLLSNPIYKGVFVWNDSTTLRSRAAKSGRTLEAQMFPRPELQLVSEALWSQCNAKHATRSGYGGGKHALAGLLTCGYCQSTLVLSAQSSCRSLYCANCTVAKAAASQDERLTSTVAAVGVQMLLVEAARYFLTASFVDAFKASLRERLSGGVELELQEAKKELARLERGQERLSHMLASADEDDSLLTARYAEARERVRDQRLRLEKLQAGVASVDRNAIESQLETVDVSRVLQSLFDAELSPQRVRAVLGRLFPEIVFEGKLSRYCSFFKIRFAVGAALALASSTGTVDEAGREMRFELRYAPDRSKGRSGSPWSVKVLDELAFPHAGLCSTEGASLSAQIS
tara:strand:- start:521 stop:2260 length:1740 start_codon:yes stop_codon:yes gene_type:complete